MALRAKWTVRIEGLKTRLRVGAPNADPRTEPMSVSLEVNGLAPDAPQQLDDCFDYAPICEWVTREWPLSDAAPLLETRVNQLLTFLFECDRRVQDVWVGVYKTGQARGSARVGVERRASRTQFQSRLRAPRDR
jgi:dihydroneopterin aldolase